MSLAKLFSSAIIASAALAAFGAEPGGFRASSVKVDITPQDSKPLAGYPARRSTGIHDRISHRIAVFESDGARFVLVSSDLCIFTPSVYDEAAALLKSETGIEPVRFWWTVTHTHSAPEVGPHGLPKIMMPERYGHPYDREFTTFVERALVDGVKQALGKLEPARLTYGTGYSAANINRRSPDPQGRISLGLNPDGPTDRQIGLIRLERPNGSPIALIANYSMHGTALGQRNTLISGDAPGEVANYVAEKIQAPMLYINGAAGNLAPIYTVQDNFRAAHITEFNVLLGDKILAANRSLPAATGDVHLRAGEKIVETPRRKGFGWDPEVGDLLLPSKGENGTIKLPVRFLIINEDLAVWSAPVELFCEISMDIRDKSPFRQTFYFGYANGWLGYLATRQAFTEGGYETKTCPFTDRVEEDLTNTVVGYLQGRGR